MCANNRVHYDLMVEYSPLHSTLPHYHHYADLFEGIELLNACQIYSVASVSKIKSVLSIIFRAIYGTGILSLPISVMMIVRIHVFDFIIIIKSEV